MFRVVVAEIILAEIYLVVAAKARTSEKGALWSVCEPASLGKGRLPEDRSCLEAGLWGGRVRPKAHCALKAPRATLKDRALSPLPASNGG